MTAEVTSAERDLAEEARRYRVALERALKVLSYLRYRSPAAATAVVYIEQVLKGAKN